MLARTRGLPAPCSRATASPPAPSPCTSTTSAAPPPALIAALREGKSVALVSDAGTPALSDPGAWLVAEAHRAGIRVSPVPGPSAAAAALSVSGFAAPQFLFAGFLPASAAARRKALEALDLPWPVVIYEAPHRIADTLEDLRQKFGDAREILVARELTKKFEEVARLPLAEAPAWLAARAERSQGEFVLVLAPGTRARARRRSIRRTVLRNPARSGGAERGGAARGEDHRRAKEPALPQDTKILS